MNKKSNVDLNSALTQSKQNIYKQATMALLAIIVCIVLCFALTVAWYTNVLHTSDLAFKAKDWNFKFEGDITVGSDGIYAAPGESGVIPLSLQNTSGEDAQSETNTDISTIGVKVNIDKSSLTIMAPRIYFYVDEQETINEEVVEKQYVTATQGYTYTVYPGQELKISETYSNQPQLRWEWVYDVVGYYVYGTMSNNELEVLEYIRPIEYDIDKAVYDAEHNLVSVDGIDVDTFILENYLKKDGFVGPEDDKIEKVNGYYKVNENIYIKLLNRTQILENNAFDTALATSSTEEGYPAKIYLTGQKADETSIVATTSDEIATNLNKKYDLIKLEGNTTLVNDLVVEKGTDVIIDLNGYTLIQEATITANEGSSIGFMNGTIQASENTEKPILVSATSSEVYLDNVHIDGFYRAIAIDDSKSNTDSYVSISNSEINTENYVVWLRGNGDQSGRKTTLLIDNSKLTSSEYIPVGVIGSLDMSGMDTTVHKSELTGKYAAIYHPATNSQLTITDSTLIGGTALVIKGGHVVVENTTIQGIGAFGEPKLEVSGFSDTGDGIYIEDNYVTDNEFELSLTINGSYTNVSSINSKAIHVFEGTSNKVGVLVNAGTFSSDVSAYLPKDNSKVQTVVIENKQYTVNQASANQ